MVSANAIWNLAVVLNCWQDVRSIFKLHVTTNCTDYKMKPCSKGVRWGMRADQEQRKPWLRGSEEEISRRSYEE